MQIEGPIREIYRTVQTRQSGWGEGKGCDELIRFSSSPLLVIILWVSKDTFS